MIICIEIFILCLIIYSMFLVGRFLVFEKEIKKEKKQSDTIDKYDKNVIIVIPALREQKCLENTIKYFNDIEKESPIIIVTTQKEVKENLDNQTLTQDIVKTKILPKYKNVYWIDYPHEDGYMADQLNYMIENLDEILNEKMDLENTYLALYNADSKPNKNTFKEIRQKIKSGDTVIQQYSYCMKNYNELTNLLKGFSIYQSNFEIKTGLINSFLKSRILYTHVVGHGLIINMQILKDLGNFNTEFWCEDIYLGLQLKFKNIAITPLLSLENMETPASLSNLIKQNSVWFKTTSQFIKIFKDITRKSKKTECFSGIIGCLNEFRCAVNWFCFPIILIGLFITTLIIRNYILSVLIILSYLLYIIINTVITIKTINLLDGKKYKVYIKTIIWMFIATLISNLGPIYSIVISKNKKYKTER